MRIATTVDVDEWRSELPRITEWFEKFGEKLPGVLWAELDALRARLDAEAARVGVAAVSAEDQQTR
jgi:phosphoenolpyruvate carboxykinase (GTP)